MFASFSNRLVVYFAALLIGALGILFVLWYFGWDRIGAEGARNQRLNAAIQMLSMKADIQRNLIAAELKERRGDVLLIAESDEIAHNIDANNPAIKLRLQAALKQKFHSLNHVYPDRFKKIFVVDSSANRILASTFADEVDTKFSSKDLISSVTQVGAQGLLESWVRPDGTRELAITHQINAVGHESKQEIGVHAVLVAVLDLAVFFDEGFQSEISTFSQQGTTLLFDSAGKLLTSFPKIEAENFFLPDRKIMGGFDGTLLQTNALGEELIVVYRNLQLSSAQEWTMVHFSKKHEVLASLMGKVNVFLGAGIAITLLALILISLTARRLTKPIDQLAEKAFLFGRGDLNVRVVHDPNEPREIAVLSEAFNRMAESIQFEQKHLEAKVVERTEELKKSEARHLALFNSTADAVFVLDAKHLITDCNPATMTMFGVTVRSDLLAKPFLALSSKKDSTTGIIAETLSDHFSLLESKGHHAFEWQFERLDDNTHFNAEVLLNRVVLNDKEFVQCTVRDISERKKVQAALYASEERHRTLVDWSPEGINVHRKGRLVYVNAAAIRMLGAKSADELIGRPISEIIHPDYHFLLRTKIGKISGEGQHDHHYDIQFVRVDGAVIDITAQGTLIDFDGEPSIYVAWHDITDMKKNAEAQRVAATAFESQEGMFVTDADWKILRTNFSFNRVTGYDSDELVGSIPRFLSNIYQKPNFFEELKQHIASKGSWQGEVIDQRKDGESFPAWLNISDVKDEDDQVTHYVGTFSDITLRKAAEEEIRNLAFYDPLTKLPNRRLLMDRLEQALASGTRHKRKGALLFIDLDNFKTLNDTHGHDHGDKLLQQVAERLVTCTREGDTVARLGGDEFVVMLENLDESPFEAATQAEVVAIKILSELNQTYWLGVNEHHSSPSIGVTLFGERTETIAEPLKRADLAMYQAKTAGRNTIRFFDPKMQMMVTQRAELEEDLRDAMLKDQFQLYYQAQLTHEGRLFGAEVLVRWIHPRRGIVSPAEFIPLSEETGLIGILGYWVMHTATEQLAKWSTQPELADLSIAVNVSPNQFHQKNFVELVTSALDLTGANPQRLKLELTEGFSIANIEEVILKMTHLKEKGVGFSLDDFGTGYSSLSYLKRLPLDQLKIDQSFVRDILIDPNDAAISKMVIVLAESLGLTVIAEGVETKEQQEFLEKQGCHAYQGYLFSKPLPLAQFELYAKNLYQNQRTS